MFQLGAGGRGGGWRRERNGVVGDAVVEVVGLTVGLVIGEVVGDTVGEIVGSRRGCGELGLSSARL